MESFKKRSIIGFILGLTMILSLAPLGAFTSKVYAVTMIDRIDIKSTTTSVEAGVLPGFTASTTTEHASIKESDSNNFWVRWPAGKTKWEGFLSDTKAAFNDGSTRYGLRLRVYLETGYQFSDDTKIYFNGDDVTTEDYTKISINPSWGAFVFIDLGLATGENPITHTVTFDTDGGTSIASRTIVDGYKTSKPSDPTKKGYIFKGWYTDNTYTTEFNFSNAIKADTTIYAKWEEVGFNVYAPTFDTVNYGYSSVSAKGISIYNKGTLDWQVKSVTVDDTSKFMVTGTAQPIIASKATDNTSFTIQPVDGLEVGTHTATITVTDMAGNTYKANVSFTVEPKDITSTITIEDITAVTYNGEAQTPTLVVKDGTTTLTLTTDYTVSYENNTNRGTATAKLTTVEGSNYTWTGLVTKDFTINPKSITPTIDAIEDQYYTGTEIKPSIVVKDGTTVLNSTTDYYVIYQNSTAVGTNAKAFALPKEGGNYIWDDTPGVNSREFTILPHTIQESEVALATETAEYTGRAIEIGVTVTANETTLIKDTDYTVTYTDNENVGTATVKVEGKGNYDGTVNKEFEITPMAITPVIANITAVTYHGGEQTPALTVTGDSKMLVKDTDYTVAYENNTFAGTATAKITAKVGSNYTWSGTVDKEFTINAANSTLRGYPADVTNSTNTTAKVVIGQTLDISTFVTLDPSEYQSEITFTITDAGLTGVSLDTDGKTLKGVATEGTVTIKALFTGKELGGDSNLEYSSADLTFYVKVVDKEVVTISGLTDNQEFTYTGNPVSLIGTITVSDDKVPVNELEVNYQGTGATDYDNTTAPTDVGTYTVTYRVSASNANYKGSVTYAFTIKKVELTKPTLSGTYTYNETEQTATLENFDATTMNVTNNTRTEAESQDITVSLKDKANYTWADGTTTDVIIPFEIAKATPTIAIDNLSQKEGSVTAVTYTVTPATTDGTVKVEYKVSTADDTTYTETLPTKNGTYTVKVSIAGDSNLEDTQNTETLTITRKTTSGGGGSSATTKYTITVKQNSNGKISPETIKVEKGNDQKFAIKANDGYEIEDVKVDGKSVGAVKEYTFENVKATHKIEATFKKVEEVVPVEPEDGWKNPFVDVSEDDWYYEAVKFANENKLFNGVSENEFGANVKMTRGMLVTVLYRLAGEPATNKSIPFADVDTAMYYANPISWAKQNGIVNGIDENSFAPNEEISRQQLVTILYRFAKLMGKDVSVGEDTNILSYDDVNQVAKYAIPAMQWACGAGIITGRTESTLAPTGNATRAEVATMLMRFINN